MDPMTLKRPKSGDGEEELFQMQEEFLRSNEKPAAKVINLRENTQAETREKPQTKGRSKFSERKRLKAQTERRTTSRNTDGMVARARVQGDIVERSFEPEPVADIAPSAVLLGNIVEKTFDKSFVADLEQIPAPRVSHSGFPEVFISEHKISGGGESLFKQQISKEEPVPSTFSSKNLEISSNKSSSVLVDGAWADEIHEANVKIVNEMKFEGIMKERMTLQATLDPAVIDFIRTRKKNKLETAKLKEIARPVMEIESSDSNIIMKVDTDEKMSDKRSAFEHDEEITAVPDPTKEIVEQSKMYGWVHTDVLEPEKLKWTGDLPTTSDRMDPNEPYNARFNFDGLLLPYLDDSLSVFQALHHHGEEPDRPGYTLQELLQLSRSSNQQQRCTALKTLANIMEKSRRGYYDVALQPPPLTALNEKNILLLLRFSLDDKLVTVITAALQALRSFLFSEADELCLDRLMGLGDYKEPYLLVSQPDIRDIGNLKDHELAQLDTVAAAMRSDIVLRIRYILGEMRPPPNGVTAALEILARLARHSYETTFNIASTPQLLEMIVKHFIPLTTDRLVSVDTVDNVYGVPVLAAIRLCRILVCYGGRTIADKLYYYKVLNSLLSYITGDSGKYGISLSIESLRLWKMLLIHGVGIESVGGAQLALVSQLRILLSNHDIGSSSELSCEHAAALITVAGFEPSLRSHICTLLAKWSTQMASIASPTWANTKLLAMTLMAAGDISLMKPLLDSRVSNIFSTLCSNLLSGLVQKLDRDPASLPNLGVLTHEGQLLPAVSQNCCIPFLAMVLSVLSKSLCKTEIRTILNQAQFQRYIRKLDSLEWSLERSWYTRMELTLVTGIVRGGTLLGDDLEFELKQIIWKLSIKLISALPADAPFYVKEMVHTALSREKLELETLLGGLNKLQFGNSSLDNIDHDLDLPEDLACLYEYCIMYNGSWEHAAMPKDWLYLPLVNLYTKCRKNYDGSVDDNRIVAIVLSLEITLPELVENLSPSLRYTRLLLAYLCGTLFLDKNVAPLLTRALSTLLQKHYKDLDLTSPIPGSTSFTDLFTVLCEHFAATSYGDEGFGMAMLVPLAQRQVVHYRKMLWAEHAGALRSLRITADKLAIPLREYLYPVETDCSLIEYYLNALARGTVRMEWCPVMYTVALHHAAMNLKENNKPSAIFRSWVERLVTLIFDWTSQKLSRLYKNRIVHSRIASSPVSGFNQLDSDVNE